MRIDYRGSPAHIATGGRTPDPKAPALLMLHGSGQSHLTWLLQSRWLAYHGYSVYAPDFPGHGLSGGAPLASIEEMADWTAGLVEKLKLEQVVLTGHSQGCLVALETAKNMAVRETSICKGLVLIAAGLSIPVNEALLETAKTDPQKAARMMTGWGHGQAARLHDHSQPGLSHLGFSRQLMAANDPAALGVDLAACQAYRGGTEAAAELDLPALVILAEKDRMTPVKAGRAMAAALNRSQTIEIPEAGHMLPPERPEEINRAIAGFMEQVFNFQG